ncbi:MAG: DUF4102 domain-containing protein [Epsilonproteobacteria bacterium]|nr:DUF4102 domain-containing protein [Campylobacterota bacterium]
MKLTTPQIRKAKIKEGKKKCVLIDGNGLRLEVKKHVKQWVFRIRREHKEYNFTLGSFPKLSLAKARKKRNKLRKIIDKIGVKEAKRLYKEKQLDLK